MRTGAKFKGSAPKLRRRDKPPIKYSSICLGIAATIVFGLILQWLNNHGISSEKNVTPSSAEHKSSPTTTTRLRKNPLNHLSGASAIQRVREEFYNRYGGKDQAHTMLAKTITVFGGSVAATAERILRAAATDQPFIMGFAGYSITVGRGNFFNQSFPFVVERILKEPMRSIGVANFFARNAAIGGIPSFPYAFCLEHFVGNPDIISWDFAMNEQAKNPAVLEAYLRQVLHQLPKQPTLILMDTNPLRQKLLEDYTKLGILKGAISVAKADTVLDKELLSKPDSEKPPGLQQWDEFGAPDGCPGKGAWHPKKMEHEFMGWMIAMHLLDAIEHAHKTQILNPDVWHSKYVEEQETHSKAVFPKALSPSTPENTQSVTEILFGHQNSQSADEYIMKDVSCRTNFLPATDKDKTLPSIIVSGLSTGATSDNIMDTRNDDLYKKGWVLDVADIERTTKRKVEKCGGLGYIDMKIALYGIPESGPLELFLPFEGQPHDHDHDSTTDTDAKHWFDGFLVCEANDKRGNDACKLDQDVEYNVGGVVVPKITPIAGAGEYLKRTTCVSVGVPDGAKATRQGDKLGLTVTVSARSKVTRNGGACCISHVVWEQH